MKLEDGAVWIGSTTLKAACAKNTLQQSLADQPNLFYCSLIFSCFAMISSSFRIFDISIKLKSGLTVRMRITVNPRTSVVKATAKFLLMASFEMALLSSSSSAFPFPAGV
jgi:hypothetical protein